MERRIQLEAYNLNEAIKGAKSFKQKIEEKSGVKLSDCYQCGKCSAGCPLAFAMDYTPRQIIRLLQVGLWEKALKAKSVWVCAACETCFARCPQEVGIPKIMEAVRIEADKKGIKPEKTVDLFTNLFLQQVEKYGRNHEMGMMVRYNILSLRFFQDALHAPKLVLGRKISPIPHKIKGVEAVKKIFKNVRAKGGNV